MIKHYISPGNVEEVCGRCGYPATHKIEEVVPDDELGYGAFCTQRHPFTNWVCCTHFGEVMGPMAVKWCRQEKTE